MNFKITTLIKSIFYNKDGKVRVCWAVLVLYFNRKVKPLYHPRQGRAMLFTALIFELFRVGITLYKDNLGLTSLLSTGALALIFLVLVFLITRYILKINLKDIGLKKLSLWNQYEKAYLSIIAPLGFFIFYHFTKNKFHDSLYENGWGILFITFIFYLSWGFYQEWIYRGFIQTELTRKFGAVTAIVLANLVFTLGPLHFHQLYEGKYMIVASTFLIGLLFGILYHRSYNLWIVGILHGIGNWFLVGLP